MSADTAFEVGRLFEPIERIADVLTASQKDVFVRLPALAGYWPMGIRTSIGGVTDHSGNSLHLGQTGVNPVGYDGDAYTHLGNGTNYLSSTGAGQIIGTEGWVDTQMRGLTLGGWFMVDAVPSNDWGFVSRDGLSSNRGYGLWVNTSNVVGFFMSGTGGALTIASGPVVSVGVWNFIVGRFTPSTEVSVHVSGTKVDNVTAVPSIINLSTNPFEAGRFGASNTNILHGKARDVFVCAASLSDALIEEIRLSSVP